MTPCESFLFSKNGSLILMQLAFITFFIQKYIYISVIYIQDIIYMLHICYVLYICYIYKIYIYICIYMSLYIYCNGSDN